MRSTYTILFFLIGVQLIKAQLPDGSDAPNWTMTDLNQQSHTLFNYLDAGYGVILDFSATWCGPCWNYHNTNALKDLHNENGPNGTNEAFVIYIEGSAPTQDPCLYGPQGPCPNNTSTQGNWVFNTPYPIINDHSQNGAYQIAYFPTIYGVCPTNTVQSRKIYLLGQRNKSGLYDFVKGCSTLAFDHQVVHVDCFGDNNGAITIVPRSGVTPITYHWSNGATTATIANLAPGTYICTVTDGNGQSEISDPIVVLGPTEPVSISVLQLIPENCAGGNGSISTMGLGGNGGYTYQWSNFASGSTINNLVSGNYSLTVTDSKGCSANEAIFVDRIPNPQAFASADNVIDCVTPSILIDGSGSTEGPNINYLWTTNDGNIVSGETTLYPEVNQPGTYTLIVSDNQWGCSSSVSVQVAGSLEHPIANAGPDRNLPCGGGELTIQASGNSGHPYQINWTTQGGNILSGAQTLSPVVNAAGIYILTILDASNGCSTTDQMIVSIAGDFVVTTHFQDEQCVGENNGSASAMVIGAQGVVSYQWSNGAQTQSIHNLAPGTYTVTVVDGSNCSVVQSVEVKPATPLEMEVILRNESDDDAKDGSIEIIVDEQCLSSFSWSNGERSNKIEGLSAGEYSVTIVDCKGCVYLRNYRIINENCALFVEIAEVSDPICYGSNNGHAVIRLLNEKGEVQIHWSDGGQGAVRNDLVAGVYSVEISDENNCPRTIEVVIEEQDEIPVIALQVPAFECAVESEERGILIIEAQGEGPYEYIWSNGLTGSSIEVGFGSYWVSVIDTQGCQSIRNFTTPSTDNEAPVAIGRTDKPNISVGFNGEVVIPGEWLDDGSYDNCQIAGFEVLENPLTCENLGSQILTLIAIDSNGNRGETQVEVFVIDDLAPKFDCPDRRIRVVSANPFVEFDPPKATDNCFLESYEQILGPQSGQEFSFGPNEIAFIARDQSGNEAICRFIIFLERPHRFVEYEEEPCNCPPVEPAPLQPWSSQSRNNTGYSLNKMAVYPNPVQDRLWFDLVVPEATNFKIAILDMRGVAIYSEQRDILGEQKYDISLSNFENGVYILKMQVGDCLYNRKIVVQK